MAFDLQDHVKRAVAGDHESLTTLLEQFGPPVRAKLTIARKWSDVLDPDDVMQVTYMEAFLRIAQFDPGRAEVFEAWLTRIAENNLRDAIKSLSALKRPPPGRRMHAGAGDASTQQLLINLADPTGATASSCVATSEGERLLLAAIDDLPADYREVVKMCDIEGRSAREAGAALGRTTGAVHMLRTRAHDRLRELLGSPSRFLSSIPARSE